MKYSGGSRFNESPVNELLMMTRLQKQQLQNDDLSEEIQDDDKIITILKNN